MSLTDRAACPLWVVGWLLPGMQDGLIREPHRGLPVQDTRGASYDPPSLPLHVAFAKEGVSNDASLTRWIPDHPASSMSFSRSRLKISAISAGLSPGPKARLRSSTPWSIGGGWLAEAHPAVPGSIRPTAGVCRICSYVPVRRLP